MIKKPPVKARINRSHPLADSLHSAFLFDTPHWSEAITRRTVKDFGSSVVVLTKEDGKSAAKFVTDAGLDLNITPFITSDFTIIAYVQTPSAFTGSQSLAAICGQGDTSAGEWMFRTSSAGKIGFYGDAGNIVCNSGNTLSTNTDYWFQCRGTTDDVQVRTNNAFQAQDLSATLTNMSTTAALQIGCADSNSSMWWGGLIYELWVFKKYLSISEMQLFQDDPVYRYNLFQGRSLLVPLTAPSLAELPIADVDLIANSGSLLLTGADATLTESSPPSLLLRSRSASMQPLFRM